MQTRAITGIDFEKGLVTDQWINKEIRPRMVWDVKGKNVFEKLSNVNYNPMLFNLSDRSVLSKSDFVFHCDDTMRFEVKKYPMSKFKSWILYSEPFFKVSSVKETQVVDINKYNKFTEEFYEKRKDILDTVLTGITTSNLGIRCIDGFIPQEKLDFKVVNRKGWAGYNRISIMCKMK